MAWTLNCLEAMRDLAYNVLILAVDGVLLTYLARTRSATDWARSMGGAAAIAVIFGIVFAHNLFHVFRLFSFAVFGHVPLVLVGAGLLLWRRWRPGAIACAACVLVVAAAGVEAFRVEPTALEINRVRIETSKIERPLTIAVVADLQTDRVGDYERRALSAVLQARPDLILLPGDFVQAHGSQRRQAESDLRALLQELDFGAPLGAFAVRGNVERHGWVGIFEGTGVTPFPRFDTRTLGPVSVSGLDLIDSFNRQVRVPAAPGFHIVFGHAPDFALGDIDADLLVAGHTHGGQVRLPLIGPLITFSRVPRSWAAGVTRLASGATLVVSRGIGMERGYAPRMRFLCRPELVLIELVPLSDD